MESQRKSTSGLMAALMGLGSLPRGLLGPPAQDIEPVDQLRLTLGHAAHPIVPRKRRKSRFNKLRAHSRSNPYIADAQFDSSGHAKRLAPPSAREAYGYPTYQKLDKLTRNRLNPHLPEAETK
jgi:hypothetical protein